MTKEVLLQEVKQGVTEGIKQGCFLVGAVVIGLAVIGQAEKLACKMKAKAEPEPEIKVDENRLKQTVDSVFAKFKRKEVK